MLKIHTESWQAPEAAADVTLLLTRRVTFAAAHVLRREEWGEERNRAAFGECARDHGHNYVLEVSVRGLPDPETGMVLNLRDLDQAVRAAVVEHVDHRHLNHDVPFLEGVVPTAENLALVFWERLERCLAQSSTHTQLHRLRLVESENNTVEVSR